MCVSQWVQKEACVTAFGGLAVGIGQWQIGDEICPTPSHLSNSKIRVERMTNSPHAIENESIRTAQLRNEHRGQAFGKTV